jgi:formate--tetrahydrofolate ligase
MLSDIDIAHQVEPKPIEEIAAKLGIPQDKIEFYGKYKAKISADFCRLDYGCDHRGNLILVSAITPTPAGEGKTTVSIGLAQGLQKLGKSVSLALREPSLGPIMGVKGGATGGGYSQVIPMEDINLHFTGDLHAITASHNLLAAMIDNHIYQGNLLKIDPRTIIWNRVLDMNDRSLRKAIIGLGGRTMGVPRETGFDITASSEVMAALCLATSFPDLKERVNRILIGFTYEKEPVTVEDLKAAGAMVTLLKDAIKPNLVQTLEGVPAFIHGGPFANIAQGTNSVLATTLALKTSKYVVTEAGFGFDLGAEKFFDIVSREAGFEPKVVVLVATIRALKMHGGVKKKMLSETNVDAVIKGLPNLQKHVENIRKFGMKAVIAINRFSTDTDEEIAAVSNFCGTCKFDVVATDLWSKGGDGALKLAERVLKVVDSNPGTFKPLYNLDDSVEDKIFTVASEIYGSVKVDYTAQAKKDLRRIKKLGYDKLPICIAKTQKSLSDNPRLLGRPKDFVSTVREIIIAAGAGFIIPITGEIMRMPGLPKVPAAESIDIDDDGIISGLY